jgi:hypothetical protein
MKSIIQRLIAAHRALDREVTHELSRRMPDQLRLARLKKERLATRDRLSFVTAKATDVGTVARDMLSKRRGPRTARA